MSTGTSISILETVVMNVPLIRVIPDNIFFLDPLAWSGYPIKPVNSVDEISICIKSILEMSEQGKNKLKAVGSHVLSNYFTETHEDNLKIFY
jgi:hypothetical protein